MSKMAIEWGGMSKMTIEWGDLPAPISLQTGLYTDQLKCVCSETQPQKVLYVITHGLTEEVEQEPEW